MSDILKELDLDRAARRKLKAIANGGDERLTAKEAQRIVCEMMRDFEQIDSLARSLPDDD